MTDRDARPGTSTTPGAATPGVGGGRPGWSLEPPLATIAVVSSLTAVPAGRAAAGCRCGMMAPVRP